MVIRELKALFSNKLLIVVLCAIMLIPAIYSGFFLASMWDPYGDLNYLPVAVVNNDEPVEYNGNTLNIGEKLANSLKDNDSMAFNVVDEKTAESGLKNGTYYMEIVIPKDFSANAATVTDKEPSKMVLTYRTNPGKNYVSMKLSESAMKEIKQNIENEISTTYINEVFNSINDMGDGLDEAVDGTLEMIEGEDELSAGNDKLTDSLGTLKDGSVTLAEGLETFNDGLVKYTDGTTGLNDGIGKLADGIDTLNESAVEGSKSLSDGAKELKKGVNKYTDGVGKLKEGSNKIVENNKTLNDAANKVSKGANDLKTGSGMLTEGLEGLETSLTEGMTDEKKQSVDALSDVALSQISTGIKNLYGALENADFSGLSKLSEATAGLGNAITYVDSSKTDISNALVIIGNSSLSDEEKTTLTQLLGGANLKLGGVESGLNEVKTGLSNAADPTLATKLGSLKTGVKTLNDNTVYIDTAAATLKSLAGSLVQVRDGLSDSIVPAMETINSGIGTLADGVSTTDGLAKGIKDYTGAVSKVNDGINELSDNNSKLQSGVKDLSNGAKKLYNGLDDGVEKLSEGADKLSDGSSKLVESNSKLVGGAYDLIGGANALSDGTEKIKDGSVRLGEGIGDLSDGTKTLSAALADGSESVKEQSVDDSNIDMMVSPVYLKEEKITKVENNGHGMAAYMMSVGLWVACLAFCLMYPLTKYHGKLTNGLSWWASKAAILYPLGLTMVFLLVGILHFALGFNPVDMKMTIVTGLVSTACFMSIMYFANLLMGKVGSFIMLIFMVLQLAGSAGTYPLEVSGSLANALHKWMPFTYSVDAFRSTISGGEPVTKQLGILLAVAVVFTVLTILLFCYRAWKVKNGKKLIYDWIESKGLA